MGDFSKGKVHKTNGLWWVLECFLLLLKIKLPGRLFWQIWYSTVFWGFLRCSPYSSVFWFVSSAVAFSFSSFLKKKRLLIVLKFLFYPLFFFPFMFTYRIVFLTFPKVCLPLTFCLNDFFWVCLTFALVFSSITVCYVESLFGPTRKSSLWAIFPTVD